MKEADFYSAEETAKVLGIPVSRVFGMLCGGELEGFQDEWARWRVPASAVQRVSRDFSLSYEPGGSREDDAESRPKEDETLVGDAATTVNSDGKPPWKLPSRTDLPSTEETTQDTGEALASREQYIHTKSGETETIEMLPHGERWRTAASEADHAEIIRELTERLSAAAAENKELQARLERAAVTEATLRESLERERQRADLEKAPAEHTATGRLEEEPAPRWGEGLWRRFFR